MGLIQHPGERFVLTEDSITNLEYSCLFLIDCDAANPLCSPGGTRRRCGDVD